jgi:hypothetical protein
MDPSRDPTSISKGKWNYVINDKNCPFWGHSEFFTQGRNTKLRIRKTMALFRAPTDR